MTALGLALGASLIYGLSDFLGGLKSRTLPPLSVLLVSQSAALAVIAAGVAMSRALPPSQPHVLFAILAGLAEALGVAGLYRGLATGAMGVAAPVAATAPTVPVIGAAVLGQPPTLVQASGMVLAIGGVCLIATTRSDDHRQGVRRSVVLGLVAALGFGGFMTAFAAATTSGGIVWILLVARATTVTTYAAVYAVRRPPLDVRGSDTAGLIVIGHLIIGADALYAVATHHGTLGPVAVLSSLYPAVTVLLASVLLRERVRRMQLLGLLVALGGSLMLAVQTA